MACFLRQLIIKVIPDSKKLISFITNVISLSKSFHNFKIIMTKKKLHQRISSMVVPNIMACSHTWPRAAPAGDCKAILERGIAKRLFFMQPKIIREECQSKSWFHLSYKIMQLIRWTYSMTRTIIHAVLCSWNAYEHMLHAPWINPSLTIIFFINLIFRLWFNITKRHKIKHLHNGQPTIYYESLLIEFAK